MCAAATAIVDDADVPSADFVDAAADAIIAADVSPMPHDDGIALVVLPQGVMLPGVLLPQLDAVCRRYNYRHVHICILMLLSIYKYK